jgi:hypothetical protein
MRDSIVLSRRRFDDKWFVIVRTTDWRVPMPSHDTPLADTNPAADTAVTAATPELVTAAALIAAAHATATGQTDRPDTRDLLNALTLLHQVQAELATIEPALIAAARRAGLSWQTLAPALGVASRQAAERRYLRLAPTATEAGTGDERVQAVRDHRAGTRAVARWANDNTADLRRLAGQVTALTDLGSAADDHISRLHDALADHDATALPALLTDTGPHLHQHPHLANQIDTITAHTEYLRRQTQEHRNHATGSAQGQAKTP